MIRLLHLFPELMNLYGEYANLLVLQKAIHLMGVDAKIVAMDDPSDIDITAFDFLYIGAGTERKVELAAEKLNGIAQSIRSAANDGMPMLFTGSASELMCKQIITAQKTIPAIGYFDAVVRRTDDRQTGDVNYSCPLSEKSVVGFINKSGFVSSREPFLFSSEFGPGSVEVNGSADGTSEGFMRNNVIATYLTGPILVKNPWLKRYFAEKIISRIMPEKTLKPFDDVYAEKGWWITVEELTKRKNQH